MKTIYCAGPLFNAQERDNMTCISSVLEEAGYKTFLPHRDGIELAALSKELAKKAEAIDDIDSLLAQIIFYVDSYQVANCDGLALNLNGRVPDEGAMVEAGLAWSFGKPVVIYKDDSRSLLKGKDNPLVTGLANFEILDRLELIPMEFQKHFANGYHSIKLDWDRLAVHQSRVLKKGEELYDFLRDNRGHTLDCQILRAKLEF